MISTILVTHSWLTTVALLAVVVLGPFVAFWLRNKRRVAWLATAAAVVAVLAITLYPENRTPGAGCQVSWSLPTLGAVELVANVLLFVPLVLFAAVASGRPLFALAAGSLLSVLIEITQAALPALGRSCDTNDWLSNTIGAVIGTALAGVAMVLARYRRTTSARVQG